MDQPEHRLSHWVKEMLERILVEPCWFTAQDEAAKAIGDTSKERAQSRMNWAQKREWYGVKPSQLDWRIIQLEPCIYAEIELKVGYRRPTEGQATTIRLMKEKGIYADWTSTIEGFYNHLVRAGFRLHENKQNILMEIQHRYDAAQDEADLKSMPSVDAPVKKPRKLARARTEKPTLSQIARTERLRSKIRF